METIRNILVAVPAVPKYQFVLSYALRMATELQATLTVALVYHRVPVGAGVGEDPIVHTYEKSWVRSCFKQIKAEMLHQPLANYHLISLDGSIDEAIRAAGPTYHSDLVITAADTTLPLAKMVHEAPYRLLLVPLSAQYHSIKRIGLAYDTQPLISTEPITFVSQLARAYAADVEVVEFGTAPHLASPETNRSNVKLDFLLENVIHRFHFTLGEGSADDIERYILQYHAQLLVVLARRQLPYDTDPLQRHTVTLAQIATVPVLVLKQ